MADIILYALWAMQTVLLLIVIYQGALFHSFLSSIPILSCPQDMDQFKSLASAVMYTSLVGIPIVFICPFIILIAFKLEYFQLMDLVQGGALWLVSIILIGLIKGLEARVWQVATADEETARERDHVVHVWRHKAFPDW